MEFKLNKNVALMIPIAVVLSIFADEKISFLGHDLGEGIENFKEKAELFAKKNSLEFRPIKKGSISATYQNYDGITVISIFNEDICQSLRFIAGIDEVKDDNVVNEFLQKSYSFINGNNYESIGMIADFKSMTFTQRAYGPFCNSNNVEVSISCFNVFKTNLLMIEKIPVKTVTAKLDQDREKMRSEKWSRVPIYDKAELMKWVEIGREMTANKKPAMNAIRK